MKRSIEKARVKFIDGSTKKECFEIHDGSAYYMDSFGHICLTVPIIEGAALASDNGKNFLGYAVKTAAEKCITPLPLPSLSELKKYRKITAAFNKDNHIALKPNQIIFQWDKGIAMKLDYLILAMEMIPDLELMAYRANCNIYGYSKSCGAQIVICPVRVNKELMQVTDVHSLDSWWECKQAMKTAAAPEAVKPEAPEAVKPAEIVPAAAPEAVKPAEIVPAAAPEAVKPAEIVPAAAPAETTPAPRKATRRAAPDWIGKPMTAYPRKPKAPEAPKSKPKNKRRNPAEFVGRKMIITIGERAARPAAD